MTRTPTPREEIYAWHTAALLGRRPQITHEPQAGWFKRRFVRGGPWIPVRIWLEQPVDEAGELNGDERLRCEVAGKERDPIAEWTHIAGHPITESEFLYLSSLKNWAEVHAPDHPAANSKSKVDFVKSPIPF